jgi:protein-L-isoaspartate(D-aspartate) O-methyltransferase
MHASALESLFPIAPSPSSPASRILDIGSGSGYLVHVMAELGGPNGRVVGVEHIRELADLGRDNMAKSVEGRKLLESGQVKFEVGDGRKGWVDQDEVEEGKAGEDLKWDKIHVGASAKVVHEELVDQLRRPGR